MDKYASRAFMQDRQATHTPLPDREVIRRQLGWDLIPENKTPDKVAIIVEGPSGHGKFRIVS